jgi:hypothetical protein
VERQVRVAPRERSELLGRQHEQVTVPDGVQVERCRATAQDERLAHGCALERLEHDAAAPIAIDVRGAEPTSSDEYQRDAGLPPPNDRLAPTYAYRLQRRVHLLERARFDVAEDGLCREKTSALLLRRERR